MADKPTKYEQAILEANRERRVTKPSLFDAKRTAIDRATLKAIVDRGGSAKELGAAAREIVERQHRVANLGKPKPLETSFGLDNLRAKFKILNQRNGLKALQQKQQVVSAARKEFFKLNPNMSQADFSKFMFKRIAKTVKTSTNLSGAKGAAGVSVEAVNRSASEMAAGRVRVLIDKAGRLKPLLGPGAADVVAGPGEVIVQRGVGRQLWTVIGADKALSPERVSGIVNRAGVLGGLDDLADKTTRIGKAAAKRGLTKAAGLLAAPVLSIAERLTEQGPVSDRLPPDQRALFDAQMRDDAPFGRSPVGRARQADEVSFVERFGGLFK